VGALEGLLEALKTDAAALASNVHICLDNLEVARQLLGIPATSSQEAFSAFATAAQQWAHRNRHPHTAPGKVHIQWVPGHADIPGNERADQEAKAAAEAAAQRTQTTDTATLAFARRRLKEAAKAAWQDYWVKNAPQRYRDFNIPAPRRPPELQLPRYTLGKLPEQATETLRRTTAVSAVKTRNCAATAEERNLQSTSTSAVQDGEPLNTLGARQHCRRS
jgi:hypothetical protein